MQIQLPKLHESQKLVRDSTARFRVVCAGRRFGKSRLAAALATECALQRGIVWIITPVYALGEPMFNDVKRLAGQIPGATINRSDRRIDYPGGGLVQVKTGDAPELLRGTSLDLAIFDEAAHTPQLEELWLETIRPSLADRKGKALFASSPAGRNYFWQLYQLGLDPLQPAWQAWRMPTSSNPFIDPQEIEAARHQLTERQFSQEFLAEFTDSSGVFRNVRELATASPQTSPIPGHQYTSGLDWGRTQDSTVFVVFDVTARCMAFMDRFSNLPFDLQLNRVATAIETWKPWITVCELNNFGQAMFESLLKRRLPTKLHGLVTTNQTKSQLVDVLSLALERREIALLNDSVLIGELMAFSSETLASGAIRYAGAGSGHDDCVLSLLMAYGPAAPDGPEELRRPIVIPFAQGSAHRLRPDEMPSRYNPRRQRLW